jgi:hypothetical protein
MFCVMGSPVIPTEPLVTLKVSKSQSQGLKSEKRPNDRAFNLPLKSQKDIDSFNSKVQSV